jgi:putative oxidoreductase
MGFRVLEVALGMVFWTAAALKFPNIDLFVFQVQQYQLLPRPLLEPLCLWLLWLEVVCGAAILWPRTSEAGLMLCSLLYSVFAFFVGVTLARGKQLDCGCFGEASAPLGWGHFLAIVVTLCVSLALCRRRRNLAISTGSATPG